MRRRLPATFLVTCVTTTDVARRGCSQQQSKDPPPTGSTTPPIVLDPLTGKPIPTILEKPLWPHCDTPEEIMEAEKYGEDDEDDESSSSKNVIIPPELFVFAFRALLYGTFFAVIGTTIVIRVAMKCCGFETLEDIQQYIRESDERKIRALEAEGVTVIRKTLDLTSPSQFITDSMDILDTIRALADEQAAEDEKIALVKEKVAQEQERRSIFRKGGTF